MIERGRRFGYFLLAQHYLVWPHCSNFMPDYISRALIPLWVELQVLRRT